MKKFLLFFIVMFLWISSVNAQTPSTPNEQTDGLFGKYFARMVKPCSQSHFVVTGFKTVSNFWDIICKGIDAILNDIPDGMTISIGGSDGGKVNVKITGNNTTNGDLHVGGNVNIAGNTSIGGNTNISGNITVDGKITQTEKPNEGDNSSVVTMGLLNEILKKRIPRVEVGTDTVRSNGRTFIRFKKRFDAKPLVIAMPVGYNYSNGCRGDSFYWNTVVNPTDIKEDWFYVEKIDRGGCGGSLRNWGISYVAVTNVDNISTNYLATLDPEEIETGEVKESSNIGGGFKYRTKIDARGCDNRYNFSWNREGSTRTPAWFENCDKTFTITPDQNALNILLPTSAPKKVILRANGERDAGDWPGSEVYTFCEWGEWCLSFGDEHKVWDYGNNHLWFTVNIDMNGTVTVRYRAHDWSANYGGANFIAETFY